MKVIRNVPHELRACDNCGRTPKFLAVFTRIQRPTDAVVALCVDCLNDAESATRDRLREDFGKQQL